MRKILIAVGLFTASASASAQFQYVKSVVAPCDVNQASAAQRQAIENMIFAKYKLIAVTPLSTTSPTPGFYPTQCSYTFAFQE